MPSYSSRFVTLKAHTHAHTNTSFTSVHTLATTQSSATAKKLFGCLLSFPVHKLFNFTGVNVGLLNLSSLCDLLGMRTSEWGKLGGK
jgi:hypothetical protein